MPITANDEAPSRSPHVAAHQLRVADIESGIQQDERSCQEQLSDPRNASIAPSTSGTCGDCGENVARELCWVDGNTQAIRTAWQDSETAREPNSKSWEQAMYWLLATHPERAVLVMRSTVTGSTLSSGAIWSVMKRLAETRYGTEPRYTNLNAPEVVSLFLELLKSTDSFEHTAVKIKRVMYLILTRSDSSVALQLYDVLKTKEALMASSKYSLLHFAYYFGRQGDFKRAVQFLDESVKLGMAVTSSPFLSTCNKILRASMLNPNGYHSSITIISRLISLGLEPNLQIYTVLMRNAFEAGDPETALKIFDILEQANVQPDNYTYAILLQGLRDYDDSTVIERIISKAIASELNDWAATELILCLYFLLERNKATNIYSTICGLYLNYFNPSPLRELGILPGSVVAKNTKSTWKPPRAAIGIMLSIFLKHHGTQQNVVDIFDRFRTGIVKKNELAELAIEDYTYNAFLHTASQWRGTLRFCADIIRGMTRGVKDRDPIWDPQKQRFSYHVKPTVQTWNTLVHAFARHNQPAAAEKVVELMQERGLKPDIITWTSIIRAHAQAQDIEGVADALMRKEESGFMGGDRVAKALKPLKDPDALSSLLAIKLRQQSEVKTFQTQDLEIRVREEASEAREMEDFLEDSEPDLGHDMENNERDEDLSFFEHELVVHPLQRL